MFFENHQIDDQRHLEFLIFKQSLLNSDSHINIMVNENRLCNGVEGINDPGSSVRL